MGSGCERGLADGRPHDLRLRSAGARQTKDKTLEDTEGPRMGEEDRRERSVLVARQGETSAGRFMEEGRRFTCWPVDDSPVINLCPW